MAQTSTSSADLNKENAGKQPGKSFTDGQSGLIPGETLNSAGGDMANWTSNDAFNHPVPVKHGKSAIINNPDIISSQAVNLTPTIALAQEAGRIGNTGPNIGSNSVGNISIGAFTVTGFTVHEKHVNSGTNYNTLSGTLAVSLSNVPNGAIIAVYSGATTSTGVFPTSSVGALGAGWSQTGNSLVFTNGSQYFFSGASFRGLVPASGADYYVGYTYMSGVSVPATTTASFTGLDNNLNPLYIPNVGNRFAR